jgi:hypothetical protein
MLREICLHTEVYDNQRKVLKYFHFDSYIGDHSIIFCPSTKGGHRYFKLINRQLILIDYCNNYGLAGLTKLAIYPKQTAKENILWLVNYQFREKLTYKSNHQFK